MPSIAAPTWDGRARITPEERSRLVPSLTTRAQLDEAERHSIHAARLWSMRDAVLRREDLLTESFARKLHGRMFGGIWRGAGRYRTTGREPGWEAQRIPEGVRLFLDDAEGWIRYATFPPDEAAVRLHHRLVAIHPWANGNGRHARLLADILVASCGGEPLSWGSRAAPTGSGSARERYLDAIRAADAGRIAPLLDFARG